MDTKFSSRERAAYLKEMSAGRLDLLVIGGGITGAGIAWDATLRGMTTGLVEMNDFASKESYRSTKLIHEGFPSLKPGEISFVREYGSERDLLYKSTHHLVKPIPVLLPIYKTGTYGYWTSSIALLLYSWLAGGKHSERRKMYNRNDTTILEPLLRQEGSTGGGYYNEYQTDDARITIEIIKSARANGAIITNYTNPLAFIYRGGRVVGVKVEDLVSGLIYSIYAKKIVNAAGHWMDELRTKDNLLKGTKLPLAKDVYVVLDHRKMPLKQAAYIDVPGRRTILCVPHGRKTYIKATDTIYEDDNNQRNVTKADRQSVLDAINYAFPNVHLCESDMESVWCDLRSLQSDERNAPSTINRGDEIIVSDSGLLSISGSQRIGFRKMSEKVVNLVSKQLQDEEGTIYPPCTTDRKAISGGILNSGSYYDMQKDMVKQGRTLGINVDDTFDLMSRYGSNTIEIFRYLRESDRDELMDDQLLHAEIQYSIHHEMTLNAIDFLLRRTGWMLFDRQKAERILGETMSIMSELLEWDSIDLNKQWSLLQEQLKTTWGITEETPTQISSTEKPESKSQLEFIESPFHV